MLMNLIKRKSALITLLLVLVVWAQPQWEPLAKSTFSPITKSLPDEIVYEDHALRNVYKTGLDVNYSTPFVDKMANGRSVPDLRSDDQVISIFTTSNDFSGSDRPLYVRENDPTHAGASRVLAIKLDSEKKP